MVLMDRQDKLNMIMNMRYHINYCALFNDHHDEDEADSYPSKVWYCSDCLRYFPARQSYKRHIASSLHARHVELLNESEDEIDDKNGLFYPCHICRKVYTSPIFLARHETSIKHKARVLKKEM